MSDPSIKKTSLIVIALTIFAVPGFAELTPMLEEEIDESNATENIDVIISFKSSDSPALDDIDDNYGVEENFSVVNASSASLTGEEIEKIQKNYSDNIERIEPDYIVEKMVRDSASQIGYPEAENIGYKGENSSIAVLDTGIDREHSYLNIKGGFDTTGEGEGDFDGHGTHVAGIINLQHPEYTGIAPEADIYDVKVLNGSGRGTASQIIEGVDWAVQNDVEIISMSLGSQVKKCNGRDIISRTTDRAFESGHLVVAAAGNTGPNSSTLSSPGCSRNALTVGAVNRDDTMAEYSSRGPTEDGRTKPDVVAPGTQIISTAPENNFRRSTGTSMAAPHVTGQAALIMTQRNTSAEQTKQLIRESSKDLGYDENIQGKGRINLTSSFQGEITEKQEAPKKSIINRMIDFIEKLVLRIII